ncbi:MAG: class II aldolase/adducin family protein [Sandaracinaceae bacterium]|nr:class II aldolase/adducin family protein [Sandaracinaceae bacterium]
MNIAESRAGIVDLCKRLHARNLLAAADGNISVRISDDEIVITPTARNKAFIREDDLAVITLDNRVVAGAPSGERLLHLEVFKRCPLARVVVHAHPPTAIAWSVAYPEMSELPREALSEIILAVGHIPIARYAEPGTTQMAESVRSFLPESRVMILARHGALSWGEDFEEAYNGMERIEHTAQILKSAHELGGITQLPSAELERLYSLRKSLERARYEESRVTRATRARWRTFHFGSDAPSA